MHPLDISFTAPLSTFFNQEVKVWLFNHPRHITLNHVASLFGGAYLILTTLMNAVNGLKKSRIDLVNQNVFSEDVFASSLPTDLPDQANVEVIKVQSFSESIPDIVYSP